ncbi:MAG: hypothetical protein ACLP00_18685, partial [Terracidiphilus sp.]
GYAPMRHEETLKPFKLSVSGKSRILDARVLDQTRQLCGISVASDPAASGSALIQLTILEHGDGAKMQFIYAGDPKDIIRIDGATIGAANPSEERVHGIPVPLAVAAIAILGLTWRQRVGALLKQREYLIRAVKLRTIELEKEKWALFRQLRAARGLPELPDASPLPQLLRSAEELSQTDRLNEMPSYFSAFSAAAWLLLAGSLVWGAWGISDQMMPSREFPLREIPVQLFNQ